MLSYRHAFHAGNHADVLKHWLLVEVLSYLNAKDKPWSYFDTHAGNGITALDSAYARKLSEYRSGIGKLWVSRKAAPAGIETYLALVETFNLNGQLKYYPGSSALAKRLARHQDRLHLFELHPADYLSLTQAVGRGRFVHCYREDGLAGLIRLLPPPTGRGCILIDPSYEVKQDCQRVAEAVQAALKRFPQGEYLIWYPLLLNRETRRLAARLVQLAPDNYLQAELRVCRPPRKPVGMFGSGVVVLNPPWTLPARCQEVLPWLTSQLGHDSHAAYALTYQIR